MRLAQIFQTHAVLQRDIPIPIWGEAAPGTRVTVTLGPHTATAKTGSDGRWLLRLPSLPAGGPHTLAATAEGQAPIILDDLLIGEVWIASGQSNMEFSLSSALPDDDPSSITKLPHLRLFSIGTLPTPEKQTSLDGRWQAADPHTLGTFSAVAGWFGRTLQTRLDVPVGIIVNALGGTRIQAWLSREALMLDPSTRNEIAPYEALLHSPELPDTPTYTSTDDWFRNAGPETPGNPGLRDGWAAPDFDDSAWGLLPIPSHWQDHGHDFNGILWFRRRIQLPTEWRGQPLILNLGSIDKHDDTYVNGHRVGGISWENLNSWCTPRVYEIPPALLDGATELVIAVRVRSHLYHGGMTGPAEQLSLHPAAASSSLSLAGDWRYAIEQNWGTIQPPPVSEKRPGGRNAPYTLFNCRLYPLIPYGIRGFIWYQGEANTSEAPLYRRLIRLLIADWRRAWGQGDLPFLQVQLASFMPAQSEPTDKETWPALRASQASVLRDDPHTGLAVAIDVGEAGDIHPRNKKPVGLRLASWALSRVYGQPGTPSGPLLRSCQPAAPGQLRLCFDYADGLTTTDAGPVQRLEIAGPDRQFRWAQSQVENGQLLVWHPEIPHPTTVRYAWSNNPEGCNLTNASALPAVPFDTDELDS